MIAPSDYVATGTFTKLGDSMDVYKVGSGRTAVVVLADIFGIRSGRHIGICDHFASVLECTVFAPDLFKGERFESVDLKTFCMKFPPSSVTADLDKLYAESLPNESYDKIVILGFCWGSWIVYHEGARMKDERIVCGVNFHPSLRLEGFFGGDTKSLSNRNQIPQLLFPCSDDPENIKSGIKCELQENLATIHLCDQVKHGFSSQGDITDPVVKENCEKVFRIAENYIKAHL